MTSQSEESFGQELRDSVGQLFIVGFHGHVPSDEIKTLITKYRVGSIILFQRNIQSATQLQKLTSDLQSIAQESGHIHPLFIGIDQENGLVTRIKEPIAAQLPGSMALAATENVKDAYDVGFATAQMLRLYGINLNYGPVADVNLEPINPVIGVRSPSDDPQMTGRQVCACFKGLRHGMVVSCIKHFPGHGDTAVDSHVGLPVIKKTRDQLEECELVPFRRAIVEGVDAIMTAHIMTPKLHSKSLTESHRLRQVPASLNPDTIVVLREDLDFKGLIVSDCLEMDAVRAEYGTVESALYALQAGTDCVMICHTFSVQVSAIERVMELTMSGQLQRGDIETSVARVRELKQKHQLSFKKRVYGGNSEGLLRDQRELAASIYPKSTTVVRHSTSNFPLQTSLAKLVLITVDASVTVSGAIDSGDQDTEDSVTGSSYTSIIEAISPDGGLEVIEVQLSADRKLSPMSERVIDNASAVIFASRNALLDAGQRQFGIALGKRLGSKLFVVATCEPYDFLDDTDEILNYVTIYEPTIPAFKAAIDVLFGIKPALGQLPVKLPKVDFAKEMTLVDTKNEDHMSSLSQLWERAFPDWSIPVSRLKTLIEVPHAVCLLHPHGFCLAYLCDGMGKLTAIGVLPEFQNKGLGTAFIKQARKELSRIGKIESWSVGSVFPRFWAGVPFDLDDDRGGFFIHRGFRQSTSPTARDLFQDITKNVATPEALEKVSQLDVDFVPWSPSLEEETMKKQEANFGNNKAWVAAYKRLASNHEHHNVLVARDRTTKSQIGWTLMCEPSSIIADDFAFLPLCPSKEKTGLIACVGIDKSARGRGVGMGLMVKAMENMKERGVEGVLIDWVVIRGFYETVGFKPLWHYEAYDWPGKF